MKAKLHDEQLPDNRNAFHYLIAIFCPAPLHLNYFLKEE